MFTGIIEELGTVESLDLLDGDAARLTIRARLVTRTPATATRSRSTAVA